jgi:predicted amidophosphoribosyltransferase
VEQVFDIQDAHLLENRHALLVDDVITTGATMEACGWHFCKSRFETFIGKLCHRIQNLEALP